MAENSSTRWLFDNDALGAAPVGFSFATTGSGRAGRWSIRIDDGRRVLAQVEADETRDRFPIAVADVLRLKDLRVEVRCKPVSGTLDEACGLVFRYRDQNNYYVARANALADDIRLYQIANGRRRQLASWDGKVVPRTWHTLAVQAREDELEVFWDGSRVIHTHDGNCFGGAGKLGVWTQADSVSYFDGLSVHHL